MLLKTNKYRFKPFQPCKPNLISLQTELILVRRPVMSCLQFVYLFSIFFLTALFGLSKLKMEAAASEIQG